MTATRLVRTVAGAVVLGAFAALPVAGPASAAGSAPSLPAAARPAVARLGEDLGPLPAYAGARIESLTTGKIYLVDPEGYKRWIPDSITYHGLFRSPKAVTVDDRLVNSIEERPALESGAALAAAPGEALYFVSNGEKRLITGQSVLAKYGFDFAKVHDVPAPIMHAVPTGDPWI
jgi:hypothetical protein